MSLQTLTANIYEKQIIEVEISPKQTTEVNFTTIDTCRYHGDPCIDLDVDNLSNQQILVYNLATESWINIDIVTLLKVKTILNEIPTKISANTYRASTEFLSDTLIVYLNGIKENNITELTNTDFQFNFNIVEDDVITIGYIKNANS